MSSKRIRRCTIEVSVSPPYPIGHTLKFPDLSSCAPRKISSLSAGRKDNPRQQWTPISVARSLARFKCAWPQRSSPPKFLGRNRFVADTNEQSDHHNMCLIRACCEPSDLPRLFMVKCVLLRQLPTETDDTYLIFCLIAIRRSTISTDVEEIPTGQMFPLPRHSSNRFLRSLPTPHQYSSRPYGRNNLPRLPQQPRLGQDPSHPQGSA